PDIAAFLFAQRPSELYVARKLKSRDELVAQLDRKYGAGSVMHGKQVFADNCASCHSSQPPDNSGSFRNINFWATDDKGERKAFLSTHRNLPAENIGINPGPALHMTHMTGHVCQDYGPVTFRNRPPQAPLPPAATPFNSNGPGGRGFYRPASLLSMWA